MVCPNCKSKISDNATECKNCGAVVLYTDTVNPKKPKSKGVDVSNYNTRVDIKFEDPRENVNKKALASAIISIISVSLFGLISIVGIILGIIALKEIKTNKQNGKKLAIVGIVIGIVSLISYIVLFIIYS